MGASESRGFSSSSSSLPLVRIARAFAGCLDFSIRAQEPVELLLAGFRTSNAFVCDRVIQGRLGRSTRKRSDSEIEFDDCAASVRTGNALESRYRSRGGNELLRMDGARVKVRSEVRYGGVADADLHENALGFWMIGERLASEQWRVGERVDPIEFALSKGCELLLFERVG